MAAYGGHFALICFEHMISYTSVTACDSSLKFGMHIHLNGHYLCPKQKVDRYHVIKGQMSKICFLSLTPILLGLDALSLVSVGVGCDR